MVEIDILRNSSQNILGVLKGDFGALKANSHGGTGKT